MERTALGTRRWRRPIGLGAILVVGVIAYLAGAYNVGSYSQGPSFYFSVAGSLIASFLVLGLEPVLTAR